MKIILIAALIATTNFTTAQVGITNTGIIRIYPGTTVCGFSNFTNSATASLVNDGNLYLKGDITNDQAFMPAGTGTLNLDGSAAQTIRGTHDLKTFNLVTNNASGIILDNNLSVSGTHTYTAGMITTSVKPDYLIYEAGSSYTGSSESRHVNGWVKKTGNTNFTFPVGNATYERSIALINLTSSGEFDVKHNTSVTPNRYDLYNPLVYVDSAEHWTINKISGAAAQVAMNWDHSEIPFPNLMVSDIRVADYDGTFWRSIGGAATGNSLTTGNVTSNSESAFNRNFTFGSVSYTLPLKIKSFTAGRMNDYTKLGWTIGNELNVANYELQRSDDGISFYTIHVQLPYNRNGTEFYNYDDRQILNVTVFYRLKINNLSSQVNYSHIVTVSANTTCEEFYVITNPVVASIDLYASAAIKGLYNYTIVNIAGQVVQAGTLDIKNAGAYSVYLKPAIVAGAYILVVQNEANKLQKMIIKK